MKNRLFATSWSASCREAGYEDAPGSRTDRSVRLLASELPFDSAVTTSSCPRVRETSLPAARVFTPGPEVLYITATAISMFSVAPAVAARGGLSTRRFSVDGLARRCIHGHFGRVRVARLGVRTSGSRRVARRPAHRRDLPPAARVRAGAAPARPVVRVSRSNGVEPFLFLACTSRRRPQGSHRHRRRFDARCSGLRRFASSPFAGRRGQTEVMVSAWARGNQPVGVRRRST